MFRKLVVFSLVICSLKVATAQFAFPVHQYTDSLRLLGEKMLTGRSDFVRFEANEKFKNLLVFMLSHDRAIDIDFSSVKNLSALAADDKSFVIFSWVIPRTNQTYENFGIVYALNERKKKYEITELKDVKNETTNADRKLFRKGEWWGALYYEIIPVVARGQKYYTLLGWDGNNAVSKRKVIDVLTISNMGQPSFGASLFSGYGKQLKRVVFEYSANTQMVLRYEQQAYIIEKKKKTKNKNKPPVPKSQITSDGFRAIQNDDPGVKRKRKSATMIVFDRLVPLNPSLIGVYEFYIPETNIVDGFLFIQDKWVYVPDIDARNPKNVNDQLPQMQKEGNTPVSQRRIRTKVPEVK